MSELCTVSRVSGLRMDQPRSVTLDNIPFMFLVGLCLIDVFSEQ